MYYLNARQDANKFDNQRTCVCINLFIFPSRGIYEKHVLHEHLFGIHFVIKSNTILQVFILRVCRVVLSFVW